MHSFLALIFLQLLVIKFSSLFFVKDRKICIFKRLTLEWFKECGYINKCRGQRAAHRILILSLISLHDSVTLSLFEIGILHSLPNFIKADLLLGVFYSLCTFKRNMLPLKTILRISPHWDPLWNPKVKKKKASEILPSDDEAREEDI